MHKLVRGHLAATEAESLARAENLLLGADWCLTPRMVSSHASLMLSVRSKIILANETLSETTDVSRGFGLMMYSATVELQR